MTTHLAPDEDEGPMMRARPRRTFDLSSTPPSTPPTPSLDPQFTMSQPDGRKGSTEDGGTTPARRRSLLNLTSSTLFGIYQPTGYDINREATTPWGTGAQTPSEPRPELLDVSRAFFASNEFRRGPDGKLVRRKSALAPTHLGRPRRGLRSYYLPLVGRTITLAVVGVLYGLLISHLHDRQQLAPIEVDLDRSSWPYLTFWAVSGVILGEAFPRADLLWASEDAVESDDEEEDKDRQKPRSTGNWNGVLRSVGAFVGVAFAIRKLPWQSTLQLSLTLAMANPAIWYIIDRSPPGFALSTFVALSGTAAVLSIYPDLIPSPSPTELLRNQALKHFNSSQATGGISTEDLAQSVFSEETIGVATWIASVLFVSSVCFGNIGRLLAPPQR